MFTVLRNLLFSNLEDEQPPLLPSCCHTPAIQPEGAPDSPYSAKNQESVAPLQPRETVSPAELDGCINITDFAIMDIVNLLGLATSTQIHRLLSRRNIPLEHQWLEQELNELQQLDVLSGLSLSHGQTDTSMVAYALGKNGVFLLQALGNQTYLTCYIQTMPAYRVKGQLAINQLLLNLRDYQYTHNEVSRFTRGEKPYLSIRVHGTLHHKGFLYRIEAVRQWAGWQEALTEKLKRHHCLAKLEMDDLSVDESQLVLLCENRQHMTEVYNVVRGLRLPHLTIQYTCDEDTLRQWD